ncbi:hypothetical protein [Paludisphaera borealis]|uniref:Uncharacterized protein n=1 Tax=Paludisphaera borealis TaxID=1387353 RepID=A0A1U7CSH1_9BACT|nr:hypothetical protein [Paludisphaera borealis]APW61882.1 hypothetical protein BSF38_03412 [Paludisphaera borealis]
MNPHEIVIEGTVQADGTLVLDEPARLPAGRVQIIVQPLSSLPQGDPFWDMMQSIWAGQKARGFVPRSAEQVEAERRETREHWEERLQAIERLREESRRLREQHP